MRARPGRGITFAPFHLANCTAKLPTHLRFHGQHGLPL